MTKQQYQDWCDFALRMARVVYADHERPDGAFILEHVECFLLGWDARDYENIRNWDSQVTYVPCEYSVCDTYREWEYDQCPGFYWRILGELERAAFEDDDESDVDLEAVASERADKAREQWEDQFMGPVACCVRAGLDMATEITGGVIGFTAGDLQTMYPAGVPWFIQRHFCRHVASVSPETGVWL